MFVIKSNIADVPSFTMNGIKISHMSSEIDSDNRALFFFFLLNNNVDYNRH